MQRAGAAAADVAAAAHARTRNIAHAHIRAMHAGTHASTGWTCGCTSVDGVDGAVCAWRARVCNATPCAFTHTRAHTHARTHTITITWAIRGMRRVLAALEAHITDGLVEGIGRASSVEQKGTGSGGGGHGHNAGARSEAPGASESACIWTWLDGT